VRASAVVALFLASAAAGLMYIRIKKRTPDGSVTIENLSVAAGELLEEIVITAQRIGAAVVDPAAPIGVRQNNPMHVRATSTTWQGEVPGSGGYEWFATSEDGFRAGALVVRNYGRLHGIRTIRGIITRYAPHEDSNPTEAYIANVARWTGYGVKGINAVEDQQLDTNNADVLFVLSKAITRQELGAAWAAKFSDDVIRRGVTRALQA